MPESERSVEEIKTELIPKVETTVSVESPLVESAPVESAPVESALAGLPPFEVPPATPDPVDIPTGPMPVVERGLLTGSMPLSESGVPAEPLIPRAPFVPPELLARRQPAPHSAAMSLHSLQVPPPSPPTRQSPVTGTITVQSATAGSVTSAASVGSANSTSRPAGRYRNLAITLGSVVVVVAIIAGVFLVHGKTPHKNTATPKPTVTIAALDTVKPTVTGFTTSGTGFKPDGKVYRTQTYHTAQFGNLKPGVGLVLDLGSARTVTTIGFTAADGPLTVELRSADQPGTSLSDYAKVGSPISADGPAKLSATGGGSHQYWLIWVTQLGSHSGGYAAQLSDLTVQAEGK